MKNPKKQLFITLALLISFSYFVIKKWPDKSMKVVFCDVGQGDSILIQRDFFQVLIDSGRDERVLGCLGNYLPEWDQTIEVLIITHGDEDHLGFFGEILGIYDTKMIFFPNTDKDTQVIRALKGAIDQEVSQGAHLKQPILGQTIGLPSGGKITFLKPPGSDAWIKTENDRSIVFLLEYQGTNWLFTGDLEETGELLLLKNGLLPQVNVLKVGHHGANTSSTQPFLSQVSPELAIISVGEGNKYGHPTAETLQKLIDIGSNVWRTDQLGDIELRSSDGQIWLQSVLKRE